ncbi:MliC family protein [Agaribacterium sp. ZY112]|uniref:MliC family protein n=1 Tax=Agaribacterium sp. ZY112 TaxID=3233574 RepID=UPI00352314C3
MKCFVVLPSFLALPLLLASCTESPVPESTLNTTSDVKAEQIYRCDRGAELALTFSDDGEQLNLVVEGQSMSLTRQVVASGFHYTNGHYDIRGKGDELMYSVGRMAPTKCMALTVLAEEA